MTSFGYAGTMDALRDPKHSLVKYAGATITPEAAVLAGGRLVYRGRIDDRYVELGVERPTPTRHDLADALAAGDAGPPAPPGKTPGARRVPPPFRPLTGPRPPLPPERDPMHG